MNHGSHRYRSRRVLLGALIVASTITMNAHAAGPAEPWSFVDQATAAGIDYLYADGASGQSGLEYMGGGVAVADYDRDGWDDVFAARSNAGPNLLFRNRGDGTFEEVGVAAGVADVGRYSGPLFVDLDGDGWLDLIVGALAAGDSPKVYRNRGGDVDGTDASGTGTVTFEDVSAGSGFPVMRTLSTAAGDYDRDGDLDLAFSQWNNMPTDRHLWRNDGGFTFTDVSATALAAPRSALLRTFTPNFADFNRDGWPDLAYSSDFDNSQLLINRGDGTFEAIDDAVFVDQNGMGGAVGDYDNDGHLDWFVSSIWDPAQTDTLGNRLYRNNGDGTFTDETETAGVEVGYWGWGACFADLDNDGHLDLFHVNGWRDGVFADDPSRLFHAQGDGSFVEQALEVGLNDRGQGRGVACFDYDRDGDLDLFVADVANPARLLRNDQGPDAGGSLSVRLVGEGGNRDGIGARVTVTTSGGQQVREIQAGSHYVSQSPAEAHFGVGATPLADAVSVTWPSHAETTMLGVATGQRLTLREALRFAGGFETGALSGWLVVAP